MQELRTGIGLQGYAQNDPLVAYKAEGYKLFQRLLTGIDEQTVRTIFRVEKVETVPIDAQETTPEVETNASIGG